jgi:hypothetical protein
MAATTRKQRVVLLHPEGVATFFLAPFQGAEILSLGFRWSALRSDHRLLSDSPSG